MLYAVQADLSPRRISNAELIQLTDDTNSGAVNAQLVTDILDEASAMVDSYSRNRYTVPLQASSQVKGITLTIAEYLLYLRRKRMKPDVRQAYEDAVAFLKDVSAGKAGLDQPVTAAPQSGSGDVLVTAKTERFGDGNLSGFLPEDDDTDQPGVNTTNIF
jgi:phage gp36-like protein